ncbi:uncharacterized protein VTP21DRAFT_1568 [Calcarisporiella thermophila]|uniref:uncharacterized protein n=1 Tax=Calcarisporiella thermophila TaxID=911321 RepID=UPI00374240B6
MSTAFRALLELCKRRGFLFQSAEIHGGLRGAYDYGPLGTELKKNLAAVWWNTNVYQREDVVGIDTSIITPPSVLKASGHVDQFTDALVDSLLTKERFRPDKAPELTLIKKEGEMLIPIQAPDKAVAKEWEKKIREQIVPGAKISRKGREILLHAEAMREGQLILQGEGKTNHIQVPYNGYAEPDTNSPFLTHPRAFNLMFKTFLDPIDPLDRAIQAVQATPHGNVREAVDASLASSTVYLRPETAQGIFINLPHLLRTTRLRPPCGVAQLGKSFRNEIRLEHAIFRTPEFEQMELEYFVPPSEADGWFTYWKEQRMQWWRTLARNPDGFRARPHDRSELAHYAKACVDVEYSFPWGWGEVEGVANRGDYDLVQHAQATGTSFECGGDNGENKFLPHVIESSCGLNRAMLAFMLDAYDEVVEEANSSSAKHSSRPVLRLHPLLAPIKAAVMPLISRPELIALAQRIAVNTRRRMRERIELDAAGGNKVGKRYYRHDEIGTPWCITVDFQSLEDGSVTIRDRDTTQQVRVHMEEVVPWLRDKMEVYALGFEVDESEKQ